MIRPFYLLFALLISSVAVAVAVSPTDLTATDSSSRNPSLQEVLGNIDESSIHRALHLLSDKFRDGVFPTDTNAVEALHKEDASLAARLMKLAKRQQPADNSTSSTVPPSPSSESPPPPTSQVPSTTSEQPPETTKTPEPTTPSTTDQSTPPPTTPSTTTAPSTTSSEKPPETTQSTEQTTTSESPSPTQSPTTFSTSSSTKPNTTPSPSTTQEPNTDTEPYTSTYESTTTLPNGSLSTVTAVTVIHPTPTDTTTAEPGLQTGAAAATAGLTKEIIAVVGGAVVVAMAL